MIAAATVRQLVVIEATIGIGADTYRVNLDDTHRTFTAYSVRKMSGNKPGEQYECREYNDGRQTCECKQFQVGRGAPCKHLDTLAGMGIFGNQHQGE